MYQKAKKLLQKWKYLKLKVRSWLPCIRKMESMGAKELKAQYEKVMSALNYDEDAHEETEEEKVKEEVC